MYHIVYLALATGHVLLISYKSHIGSDVGQILLTASLHDGPPEVVYIGM